MKNQNQSMGASYEGVMRFQLIDRILELKPGREITAEKDLHAEEDYLADHFPLFPVMPGVLMLEAMYQASAWLLRVTDEFRYAIVTLQEARNVKYSDFVVPGQSLRVTAEILKREEGKTSLKTAGYVGETMAVSARLVLAHYHIVDRYPSREMTDPRARRDWRKLYAKLTSATPADSLG